MLAEKPVGNDHLPYLSFHMEGSKEVGGGSG
jgi:hypothetical protein